MDTPLKRLSASDFLEMAQSAPVVDVRSPSEYRQGHIPGAVNLPLFSDEERAVVGTAFTRTGFDNAFYAGLDFTGPKLSFLVKEARRISAGRKLLVYCWRGGMRSGAMAWLFDFSGIETMVLEGGYKAYRRYIRESFSYGPEIILIGGMTGSGKTELLKHLADSGEQVIDLEALANHKGSAFGGLGELEQPSTEHFENMLAARWLSFVPDKPVWVEDESKNIGRVILPDTFIQRMGNAQVYCLEVTLESRLQRIANDYGTFDKNLLEERINKISKRLGGDKAKLAISHLRSGDLVEATRVILEYYDKAYLYDLSKKNQAKLIKFDACSDSLETVAVQLAARSRLDYSGVGNV